MEIRSEKRGKEDDKGQKGAEDLLDEASGQGEGNAEEFGMKVWTS